ncbi:MAG TPA: hypothetical protein VFC44_17490 [Candidatus Saccharimonadales bacterium]|nr:hypothetical protein [Candidatus Saccharimonadales bacterium]
MKKTGLLRKKYPPAMRRKLRKAIYDFHVRAFGEEMARVNHLPLAARRRYIGEMVDHATRKGVKSDKPALGVTP